MALPLKPWSTSYPEAQDTPGVEQPNLTNESAPGAGDGDVILVEQLHAIRDKAQAIAETIGSDLVESGSLLERVATLEGGTSSSPLTTKGDIYAHDATADARFEVGSDGYVLRAASDATTGLAWGQLTYDDLLAAYAVVATSSIATAEIGDTVTNPTVTATVNRLPTAATVNDGVHGAEAFTPLATPTMTHILAHAYTHVVVGAVDAFAVAANEAGGPTKTASCGITWTGRAFYGVAVIPGAYDAAFIHALATAVQTVARQRTLAFASAGAQHEYYCVPSSYGGAPANFVDTATGFAAGYAKIAAAVPVTNAFGVTLNYDVWESTNFGLGARNVQVT